MKALLEGHKCTVKTQDTLLQKKMNKHMPNIFTAFMDTIMMASFTYICALTFFLSPWLNPPLNPKVGLLASSTN